MGFLNDYRIANNAEFNSPTGKKKKRGGTKRLVGGSAAALGGTGLAIASGARAKNLGRLGSEALDVLKSPQARKATAMKTAKNLKRLRGLQAAGILGAAAGVGALGSGIYSKMRKRKKQ